MKYYIGVDIGSVATKVVLIKNNSDAEFIGGKISPTGAKYDSSAKGAIAGNSALTLEFKKHGWRWGGDWNSLKDYQHFEKPLQ